AWVLLISQRSLARAPRASGGRADRRAAAEPLAVCAGRSVDHRMPGSAVEQRNAELHRLVVRVEEQEEIVVLRARAVAAEFLELAAGEKEAERACVVLVPFVLGDFASVGLDPDDVL